MKKLYSSNSNGTGISIKLFFLVFVLILASAKFSFSQDEDKVNSLLKKIESTSINAEKVQAYCDLAWEFKDPDPDKAFDYGKQALNWAGDLEANTNTASLYINVGYIFIVTKNDFNKAMTCLKKANRMADNMKDEKQSKKLCAKIQEGVGMINFKLHEYEVAAESYAYAAQLYSQLSMGYNVSNCYHSLAQIYEKQGDKRKSDVFLHRETANNKRLDSKYPKKTTIEPSATDQMVKIEDMTDAFE